MLCSDEARHFDVAREEIEVLSGFSSLLWLRVAAALIAGMERELLNLLVSET